MARVMITCPETGEPIYTGMSFDWSAFDTVRIGTAYLSEGVTHPEFPRQQGVLYHCTPIYEDLPGWSVDITEVRAWDHLPATARSYVERVEQLAGVPIRLISVGPQRSATFEKP